MFVCSLYSPTEALHSTLFIKYFKTKNAGPVIHWKAISRCASTEEKISFGKACKGKLRVKVCLGMSPFCSRHYSYKKPAVDSKDVSVPTKNPAGVKRKDLIPGMEINSKITDIYLYHKFQKWNMPSSKFVHEFDFWVVVFSIA